MFVQMHSMGCGIDVRGNVQVHCLVDIPLNC